MYRRKLILIWTVTWKHIFLPIRKQITLERQKKIDSISGEVDNHPFQLVFRAKAAHLIELLVVPLFHRSQLLHGQPVPFVHPAEGTFMTRQKQGPLSLHPKYVTLSGLTKEEHRLQFHESRLRPLRTTTTLEDDYSP